MKITTRQLRRIIAEEVSTSLREMRGEGDTIDLEGLLIQLTQALEDLPLGEASATDIGTLLAKLEGPVVLDVVAGDIDTEDAHAAVVAALQGLIAARDSALEAIDGLMAVLPADSAPPEDDDMGRLGMYDAEAIETAKAGVRSAAEEEDVEAAVTAAGELRMRIYEDALDGDAEGDEEEASLMAAAAMVQFWGEMAAEPGMRNFATRAAGEFSEAWRRRPRG